ncbi:hypothetical protein PPMP20_19050 [Paraburkholderia phymatum]|uniref:Uncharacterized protein n=1 Tax=Paraburkholderia phymatum (strain DSM 17167 / CIP 108236 / LMG 21445 / STM815) TaxID=391038 RepID=B2JUJ2_PARP8|nr:hypothetical protein [Paraburkholderia phymatum]ACC76163.1 hypothetical protein Bphy_7162 [Paraburkholderia phymatum STM815]
MNRFRVFGGESARDRVLEHVAQIEANRVAIESLRELIDSKINTLRFEVTTGLASLKELKRHDLDGMAEHSRVLYVEINRRLGELEKSIERLDQANRDYVLREVYEKDEERLYMERRDASKAKESGQRAMLIAALSALVSIFNTIIAFYLRMH